MLLSSLIWKCSLHNFPNLQNSRNCFSRISLWRVKFIKLLIQNYALKLQKFVQMIQMYFVYNIKPENKICLCYTLFACFYTTIRSCLFTCFHLENRRSSQFHNCIWEVSKLLQLPSPHQLLWPSFCKVIRILGLLLSTLHNLCSINVTECLYE